MPDKEIAEIQAVGFGTDNVLSFAGVRYSFCFLIDDLFSRVDKLPSSCSQAGRHLLKCTVCNVVENVGF